MFASRTATRRSIPDPLGEIPHWFTQSQVDEAEKKLQAARDYAVKVGVPGLGLAGVPKLAMTVPYAALVSGSLRRSSSPFSEDELIDDVFASDSTSLDDPFSSPIWEVPVFQSKSATTSSSSFPEESPEHVEHSRWPHCASL